MIQPNFGPGHNCFSNNSGRGSGNLLDSCKGFDGYRTGTIEGIKNGSMTASFFIQVGCFQYWSEARENKMDGLKIRTCIRLMVPPFTQNQPTSELTLCSHRR